MSFTYPPSTEFSKKSPAALAGGLQSILLNGFSYFSFFFEINIAMAFFHLTVDT